jgi:hypothetical protein
MEEKKLNTKEVIEETAKIIGSLEIPIALSKISAVLAGCYNNLIIVLQMIDAEKNREEKKNDKSEVE